MTVPANKLGKERKQRINRSLAPFSARPPAERYHRACGVKRLCCDWRFHSRRRWNRRNVMSTDRYRSYNFQLLLDGDPVAGFIECSSLGADSPAIEHREGGEGQTVRHLPGQVRYQPATLRDDISRSRHLWNWFRQSIAGPAGTPRRFAPHVRQRRDYAGISMETVRRLDPVMEDGCERTEERRDRHRNVDHRL